MKKKTMKDIAKLAGVSIKTVSRVVNKSDEVREETRDMVLEVIRRENYNVNVFARGLKDKKINTIIVFIDKHKGSYWSMWHNEAINELMHVAKRYGYKILISPSSATGYLEDETDGFNLFKSGLADGALIFDNKKDDIRINYLKENKIPYVIIGKDCESDYNYVDLDNEKIGYIGGKKLIDLGYKNIMFLLGNEEFIVNIERSNGFKRACKEKNVIPRISFGLGNIQNAYETTIEILEKETVDAFFISGDERALGVYKAIKDKKMKIPKDIAILGIDNLKICDFVSPPLSSISQILDLFAEESIKMLINIVENNLEKCERVILEPVLIKRKSI